MLGQLPSLALIKGAAEKLGRTLAPAGKDLTVLKPRHSGFHATPLELLLARMVARWLIVTGVATG